MNRTQLPLLLKQPLHGFKVGLRHEDVYLVCSRIDDTRPIGVAGIDRGKLEAQKGPERNSWIDQTRYMP